MSKTRLMVFYLVLFLAFGLIVGRLVWLQLIKGADYRAAADNNRIKVERLEADRGVIYDRQGRVLARNTPDGREYPAGPAFAHVVGFVGLVSESEWRFCQQERHQGGDCGWSYDDWLGKLGLEKRFDDQLRGEDGGLIIETAASGEPIRQIAQKLPT